MAGDDISAPIDNKTRIKMKKYKESAILLMLFLINIVYCNICYKFSNREDPCINLCDKIPLPSTDTKYITSCCQRGCRFFNLVELNYGLEPNGLNITKDDCRSSCIEAYEELPDRYACTTGCEIMAKQQEYVDSNTLLTYPDIPENDILTDPGIRRELLPRWWDSNGFKLPQTYIKTVPTDDGTMDYETSSDNTEETELTSSWIPGTKLFQYAMKRGLPTIRILFVLTFTALLITGCMYLHAIALNKTCDDIREFIIDKFKASDKNISYILDKGPFHKKYKFDVNDKLNINLKV
ncbi:transmembrane protein 59-like [Vespula maculifrons]|uniref:Transmembrane protein 59-like n=1 Tax=Vespula maculifrons TaxID=7453 RepID=A0ABD2C9W4_VESMC